MPTKKISIVWTALPAGYVETGRTLRLSVHVSPRLLTDEGLPRPTLAQFQEYFRDWPAVVRDLTFQVRFTPGPLVQATRLSQPDSELWEALFPPDTYVRPYEFPRLDDRLVFSYPVKNVAGHLRGVYQKYAQSSPDGLPPRTTLWRDTDILPMSLLQDPRSGGVQIFQPDQSSALVRPQTGAPGVFPAPDRAGMREYLVQRMRQRTSVGTARGLVVNTALPPGPPEPALDFFQVANFFTPANQRKPDQEVVDKYGTKGTITNQYARLPADIPIPNIDFHQIVSNLGQYPKLLRDLGLVIDLEVPLQDGIVGDAGPADQPSVQIIPGWPDGSPAPQPEAIRPRTVYALQNDRFATRPRPSQPELTAGGLLGLGQGDYELLQVDVDGAALKTINYAYNLYRSFFRRSADSPLHDSLPSLRSAGLSLARTGNAFRLASRFKQMTGMEDGLPGEPEPTLYAEDVLRGYRVDVWDNRRRRWCSLHERIGKYELDAGPEREYQDEGFTQLGVASAADESADDLYLHEIFASWDGWSLSAPKPGAWLTDDSATERTRERASTDLGMEATFSVLAGSLPKLRFGWGYRLRVRGVDLAGNSPTHDGLAAQTILGAINPAAGDDFAPATPEQTYRRFEPVPPPALVLRQPVGSVPGESLERVVIRSFNDEPGKDEAPTGEAAERHVAPPKGAWSLAELHAMFELPPNDEADLYALISSKEGAFPATKAMPEAQETGAVNPIVTTDSIDQLPYLPDPIARGATLLNLPGVPGGEAHHMRHGGGVDISDLTPADPSRALARVDFRPGGDSTWWDVGAFRIRIVDATGRSDLRPEWDAGARVLTVYLPKAEVAEVPYASFLGPDDLAVMGIWDWLEQASPGNLDLLRRIALDGRHWMITPRRTLVLVHAVQQPLRPPAFGGPTPQRGLGQTFATLQDTLQVHGKSTAKLDLRAEWSEWVDAPAEPEPRRRAGRADVCEIQVDDPDQDSLALAHRHEFGDTRYRKVRYRAIATTRFREYLPPEIASEESRITRSTVDEPVNEEEAVYKSAVVDIPNAARPESPRLLYVVPAFRWTEGPEGPITDIAAPRPGGTRVSGREGGWLRVYLDRPWYSSGDGELLGLLFWNDFFVRIPGKYRPFVTQWGNDPIWVSPPATGRALPESFKASAETKLGGLTLDELTPAVVTLPALTKLAVQKPAPKSQTQMTFAELQALAEADTSLVAKPALAKGAEVTTQIAQVDARSVPTLGVAGHQVAYDSERRLWYSDIHIDAGLSYFPFVRLALARFQPISVPNAHLSRVVLADFVQLAPDRTATVSSDPGKPREVRLAVQGLTYQRSRAMDEPAPLRVRVETLRPDVPEDVGWVPETDVDFDTEKPRGDALWSGKLTLPVPRGARRYRLVIEEYEGYTYRPTSAAANRIVSTSRAGRIVYAHAIEI
jgi:hypothetical protein